MKKIKVKAKNQLSNLINSYSVDSIPTTNSLRFNSNLKRLVTEQSQLL